MQEREPAAREVNQPPPEVFRAILISSAGDSIPIDNHVVQVFQFEDPKSKNFFDIADKTSRKRFILEDKRIFEVLSDMGCRTVRQQLWDESTEQHPAHIISGGEWDIMDETNKESLVLNMQKYGRIPPQPKKVDERNILKIPISDEVLYYGLPSGELLQLHPLNAEIVEIDEFPEMSHVFVNHEKSDGETVPVYLFGDQELMVALYENGFDYRFKRYPDGPTAAQYIRCVENGFEESAAELLGEEG